MYHEIDKHTFSTRTRSAGVTVGREIRLDMFRNLLGSVEVIVS